jgi:hypothetical protein
VNLAEQRPALGQGHTREGGLGRRTGGGPYRSASAVHMPKSGSSSTSHPPGASQVTICRNRSTPEDMHEHRPGVDQIERTRRKRAGADVVPKDLNP